MAALAHELRYELLQREGNRRASITQWSPTTPGPGKVKFYGVRRRLMTLNDYSRASFDHF